MPPARAAAHSPTEFGKFVLRLNAHSWTAVMRGRRPAPTILKKLHGAEPRRINHLEPRPKEGLPQPPAHFTAEQLAVWAQAVESAPPGLLSPADAALLETWVVAWCLHRRATVELERTSLTVPSVSDPARRMPSPLITIIAKTSAIMARAVAELGFSPTSRGKVALAKDARPQFEPNDPAMPSLDDYLAEGERLRAKMQAELAKKH
jgi:P27 family predicted phage terminase small subunit